MKNSYTIILLALVTMILAACTSNGMPKVGATPASLNSLQTETAALPAKSQETAVGVITPTEAIRPDSTPTHPAQETTLRPTLPAAHQTARPPRPTLTAEGWKSLPVIPAVSASIREIYQRGLEMGNNPNAFSKIGDCGSTPAWFLGDFDRGPRYYSLGKYAELEGVIQEFQGSFDRTSLAARSGFNVSALFTPLWSDRTYCEAGEAPLACEYRIHRPIIAFITLGANDVWRPDEFEPQMRKTIETSIEQGVIPILATKADNQEGDGSINATIARLAQEYDIPLWNYWAAVHSLPNHGLQEDETHLTWGRNTFDDPEAMTKAWPVRNLTALQVLDAVWRVIRSSSSSGGS